MLEYQGQSAENRRKSRELQADQIREIIEQREHLKIGTPEQIAY